MIQRAARPETVPTMVIRADAGEKIGHGHVMRCLALAAAWSRSGGRTVFVSHELPPPLAQRIRHAGHEVVALSARHDDPLDWFTTATVARRTGAQWLVLDGYWADLRYQRWARGDAWRLLVMDDTAELPRYEADLLVNQNHGAEEFDYSTNAACHCCLGRDYLMLRPEFLDCPPRSDTGNTGEARKILVSLGGSRLVVAQLLVLKALETLRNDCLQVTIAIPPGAAGAEDTRRLAAGSSLRIEVVEGGEGWPQLMSSADLAISAAGSTAWEMAYLGVPSALISVASNQIGIAAAMAQAGAAVDLGPLSMLKPVPLGARLAEVIEDPNHRLAMTRAGRRLIDGRGADRVVAAMRAAMGAAVGAAGPAPAKEPSAEPAPLETEEVLT